MPEGRKIRSDSDYIFRLSGISRLLVTVPNGAPAFVTPAVFLAGAAGVTEVGGRCRISEKHSRFASLLFYFPA